MKNRNNDRSDASLQVNHLGDVHGSRSGARPPIREAITKKYTYHPDRAPWLVTKTLSSLRIIKKTHYPPAQGICSDLSEFLLMGLFSS
jgi:hypothetical protein